MPTINIKLADLERLAGLKFKKDEMDGALALVKGELKGFDDATGEIHLELNDTNRPDLWCVEGVARQIRIRRAERPESYPFLEGKTQAKCVIDVDPNLKAMRPYIGACLAKGLVIDDETLVQLIQVQEKLSEGFGRRRQLVSIGLYRLSQFTFPVRYHAVRPAEARFIPLGFEESLSLAEILHRHPKGIQYGEILKNADRVPLLSDSTGRILSFPPIINSREVGEVKGGDRDLFVEVTGTDLRMVILTVNILAANLADRGAKIEPVEVRYGFQTELGKKVTTPRRLSKSISVGAEAFRRRLGEAVPAGEIAKVLRRYGYQVTAKGKGIVVQAPAYRDDLMHAVDVIEDFAICRGYESFAPELPSEFTVGRLSDIERFSDRARGLLIGMGYQEIISNILTAREDQLDRLGRTDGESIVEVENVMSQTYAVLRDGLLGSLLRVESASSKSFYPHRIFEAGEVARRVAGSEPVTSLQVGALLAHSEASFSEIHSTLDLLMNYLEIPYDLEPVNRPTFIDGRCGAIRVGHRRIGVIGEIHPQVLENWQAVMPAAAFELDLTVLLSC